ncbi:MAG: hypothetical protein ISS59_03075 [Desulfobacteraceae bacterium]|nr:hypothetical protein [Desulfobacteraceae bacterium]
MARLSRTNTTKSPLPPEFVLVPIFHLTVHQVEGEGSRILIIEAKGRYVLVKLA